MHSPKESDLKCARKMRRLRYQGAAITVLSGMVAWSAGSSEALAGVCSAGAFGCPATGACVITGTWDVGAGCALDFGSHALEVRGTLQSQEIGGSFSVNAASLLLFGGKLRALGNTYTRAGSIRVDVGGTFEMSGTGTRIDISGNGGGGELTVFAGAVNLVTGVVAADGGIGESCGDGGSIDFEAVGALSMANNIHSTTAGGDCGGGAVSLIGGTVNVVGDIDSRGGAFGSEDAITVRATLGDVHVGGSATLRADGIGQPDGVGADAGDISVVADVGNVTLENSTLRATGKAPEGAGAEYISRRRAT